MRLKTYWNMILLALVLLVAEVLLSGCQKNYYNALKGILTLNLTHIDASSSAGTTVDRISAKRFLPLCVLLSGMLAAAFSISYAANSAWSFLMSCRNFRSSSTRSSTSQCSRRSRGVSSISQDGDVASKNDDRKEDALVPLDARVRDDSLEGFGASFTGRWSDVAEADAEGDLALMPVDVEVLRSAGGLIEPRLFRGLEVRRDPWRLVGSAFIIAAAFSLILESTGRTCAPVLTLPN